MFFHYCYLYVYLNCRDVLGDGDPNLDPNLVGSVFNRLPGFESGSEIEYGFRIQIQRYKMMISKVFLVCWPHKELFEQRVIWCQELELNTYATCR